MDRKVKTRQVFFRYEIPVLSFQFELTIFPCSSIPCIIANRRKEQVGSRPVVVVGN